MSEERKHSILAPSSKEWVHCGFSAKFLANKEEETNNASEFGTECHALAEAYIKQSLKIEDFDEEPVSIDELKSKQVEKPTEQLIKYLEVLFEEDEHVGYVTNDQDDFQKKYDSYDLEHKKVINKIETVGLEIEKKNAQAKFLQAFIEDLNNRPNILEAYDEDVWSYLIDKAIVNRDKSITFQFRNGKEIKI